MRSQKQTIAYKGFIGGRCGYARDLFGNPATRQERALLEAGCRAVFVEGRGHESWQAFVQSLRRGGVAMVITAGVLPTGPDGIRAALAALDGYGVPLVVSDTGKRSDDGLMRAELVLDAVEGQRKNRNTFTSKTGSTAGRKSAKKREKAKASAKEVLTLWRDTANHPNTQELGSILVEKGWSLRMMYTRFGARWPGARMGRPRKPKKD